MATTVELGDVLECKLVDFVRDLNTDPNICEAASISLALASFHANYSKKGEVGGKLVFRWAVGAVDVDQPGPKRARKSPEASSS